MKTPHLTYSDCPTVTYKKVNKYVKAWRCNCVSKEEKEKYFRKHPEHIFYLTACY